MKLQLIEGIFQHFRRGEKMDFNKNHFRDSPPKCRVAGQLEVSALFCDLLYGLPFFYPPEDFFLVALNFFGAD